MSEHPYALQRAADRKLLGGQWRRPLKRIDARTRIGKHIKLLEEDLLKRVGPDADNFTRALARSAAEMTALALDARRKTILGEGDLDNVIRAEAYAQRAVSALALSGSVPEPEPVTLAGYLARKG
jgi:hypothetical protein